jgi:hypothetical protein
MHNKKLTDNVNPFARKRSEEANKAQGYMPMPETKLRNQHQADDLQSGAHNSYI